MRERALSVNKQCRANMVSGLQTQHREPVKPQPNPTHPKCGIVWNYDSVMYHRKEKEGFCFSYDGGFCYGAVRGFVPRYQVGDHLWMQEPYLIDTFRLDSCRTVTGQYLDDHKSFEVSLSENESKLWTARKFPNRETSGRFMYKSLTRHRFEVTEVRAEQVQDISLEDIKAEGVIFPRPYLGISPEGYVAEGEHIDKDPWWFFKELWDSCYGGGKFAWVKNPWVWAYTLRKVER